jgi:aminoglycoside/choline kinase family phosphotransferase
MTGDVSRRRYARVTLQRSDKGPGADFTAVLALYPTDLEAVCERSLVSGRLLHEAGVRVPTVLEAAPGGDGNDGDEGSWVLLEDLGEATLYDLAGRSWNDVEPFFEAAVDLLPRIAGLPRPAVASLNPPLGRELLLRELAMTREAFLVPEGLDVEPRLWGALEDLCEALGDEPPVPCHRDFGARNLIPLPTRASAAEPAGGPGQGGPTREAVAVGVLDHQDLRLGPPLYDLASLLNDSLFPPADAEERLLGRAGVRSPGARQSYHRAAAQRTLKAVGSYAAFARRGGGRHVGLIRPTLARALEHLRHAPETAAAAPELTAIWRGTARADGPSLLD